jgi:5-formyltetrahydrofolate cyclo-ligase
MKPTGSGKAELRLRLRALLADARQDRAAWDERSQKICRAIREHPAWRQAGLVCAFLPLSTEPQIGALWAPAAGVSDAPAPKPALCFPRIRETELDLVRIDDPTLLQRADWKMALPELAAASPVPLSAVDLLLVPAVAFTRAGARLGRGGGFYDRLLAQKGTGTKAWGVCFEMQLVDHLPSEPHDREVDVIVTEFGVVGGRRR